MRILLWLGLSVIIVWSGCGSSSGRVAFTGTVSVAGQPFSGTIRFTPVDAGPIAMTVIDDGKYRFTAENGPLPGVYEVTIEAAVIGGQKGATAIAVQTQQWQEERRVTADVDFSTDFQLSPATPMTQPNREVLQ